MVELIKRCAWAKHDLEISYHDNEWGVPLLDDKKLFEFLILDLFQAGLSWLTILKKRENFRRAFDDFNAKKIAQYDENKVAILMQDASIIRNRLKIESTITNASMYLKLQKEKGSFSDYLWSFTEGKIIKNRWINIKEIPAKTNLSDSISKDLKKRGFSFVGSTIIYAFLQAAGIVNDHETGCFRYNRV